MGIGFILGIAFSVLFVVILLMATMLKQLRGILAPVILENARLKEESAKLRTKDAEFAAKPYVIGFNNDQIETLAGMISGAMTAQNGRKPN